MKTKMLMLAGALAVGVVPAAELAAAPTDGALQSVWKREPNKTMYDLVQAGFEVKSEALLGGELQVMLQKGKEVERCEFAASSMLPIVCLRLVAPFPLSPEG